MLKWIKSIWEDRRNYILLIPIICLILHAAFMRYAVGEIDSALLRQKLLEVTDSVNMLAAAVEANPERDAEEHEENIIRSTEFLDSLHMIYSATFKADGDTVVRISGRNFQTDFDPLDYPEFMEAVSSHERGHIIIGFAPDGAEYRDLHMYFRWMPRYSDDRYLVVAGVSKYSVVTRISVLVTIGQLVSMAVTFVLELWLVAKACRLGYIYDQREGDKWRDRRP